MFYIKDLDSNVIDLGGLKEFEKNFEVVSINNKGRRQPFHVEAVSNEDISVELFDVSSIKVSIDADNIISKGFIALKNILGERIIITVKPNVYLADNREYKFKITKSQLLENGDLKLRILSKDNTKEIGWKCIYDGKPIEYKITPSQGKKSEYITVKLLMKLFSEYTSTLKFEQEESHNIIEYKIKNTEDGIIL